MSYYPNAAALGITLRKSSYSNQSADCVVVGSLAGEVVVADSKNLEGPALRHRPEAFAAFIQAVAAGTLVPVTA